MKAQLLELFLIVDYNNKSQSTDFDLVKQSNTN